MSAVRVRLSPQNITSFCLIQEIKGLWGIPRYSEAMKDVATYDKLRGAGSKHRSGGFRMRQLQELLIEYIDKKE